MSMIVSGALNYLQSRYHRAELSTTFEDLWTKRRLFFDAARISAIDEAGVEAAFRPVRDVTGAMRFEVSYAPRAPGPGETRLPAIIHLDQEAVILAKNGWIVTQQGWLQAASYLRGQSFLPEALRTYADTFFVLTDTMRLPGVTLNAMSDFASSVYGHALWESVWKVLRYWDEYGGFADVDHIFMPPLAQKVLRRFDPAIAGAAEGKLVFAPGKYVKALCDNVVALPHPVCAGAIAPDQAALLNRHVRMGNRGDLPRRVFLRRKSGGRREFDNREAVFATAEACGYALVDPGGTQDVYALFRGADVVVGIHGSDLADVVFMRPGARMLELTPTDHVFGYFRAAAEARGVAAETLFCRSRSHRMRADRASLAPVTVDCDALGAALTALSP